MKKHWYRENLYEAEMSDLLGRTFTQVLKTDDTLKLVCEEGTFVFEHEQDCCESVYIESVVGDLNDLVGTPILLAEKSTSCIDPPGEERKREFYEDSFTWTFYKLATIKGYVDIRWLGESNGYYSEEVSLNFIPKVLQINDAED